MKKIFLLFIVGLFLISFVYGEESFTPIFCNDYEFTCCGGIEDLRSYPEQVAENVYFQCPQTATRCLLQSHSIDCSEIVVGSENCREEDDWYTNPYFTCDNERPISNGGKFNPGDYIWIEHQLGQECEGTAYIDSWEKDLGFCGKSGVAHEEFRCGVSVPGNDACTFNPNEGIIYTSSDSLTRKQTVTSYTVSVGECILAFQSGDRHICGYKEESCSSDNDCGGYNYGNQECTGRTLQTYGCRSYGNEIEEHNRGPFNPGWGEDKPRPTSGNADFGKRCEVIRTEQVQCCGDTDCGSNMFCDTSTFTCEEEAECEEDNDCGVSIQCDWNKKILKTPVCEKGKCTYNEEAVQCCNNKNCEDESFCDENYKCQKSAASATSTNQENLSSSSITGAAVGTSGGNNWMFIILGVLIVAGIGALFYFKRNKTSATTDIKGNLCPNCGNQTSGRKFCTNCGQKL